MGSNKIRTLTIAGCGGVGSNFITNLIEAYIYDQIKLDKLIVYDPDKLELKNKLYTTFDCEPEQLGQLKVDVMKENLEFILDMADKSLKIEVFGQNMDASEIPLEPEGIFVSTVDGSKFRNELYTLGPTTNNWLDLRSQGGKVLIFRNAVDEKEQLKLEPYFIDQGIENASCQIAEDLAQKLVQYGNRIIAMIGLQYVINVDRGLVNNLIFEGDFGGKL